MATEAHVPEAVSFAKKEDVDRSLTIDQCSPVELNKTKGDLDQHLEIPSEKPFADGENVQVEYSTKVESKDKGFEISEGEHFLDPLSESFQADQSSQAGMEILKSQVQLQKGTQVGGSAVETYAEENEVIEARKEKFEQDIAAGIIPEMAKTGDANLEVEKVEDGTTVDQHVQVISDQQDSIRENVQCLEKEVESPEVDITGAEKADGNAESYHKEAADLLEATTFQEYEAPTSTLDLTDSSFKKDLESETNVCNTSDTTPILQEEFEEEASTKVTSNDEEDSQQTLQNYELKKELKNLPEVTVMPEDTKTEPASENAEVKSCTDGARTIQNTPEYIEKEEAHVHCPKQNDTITEEVLEARSTEQETAKDVSPEIHPAENYLQELNEEKSRDYQASVESAQLSTDTDEKNEERFIKETCSSLVEEDTTQQVSRVGEVHAINVKEEEKEEDTKCEEPTEVAVTSREVENEERVNNTPGEKGLQTVLTDETVMETENHAQAEKIEKEIQTGEGEGERELKGIEEENKEAIDNAGISHIDHADQPASLIEDTEIQAEEFFCSKDKLEEQIPTAADEIAVNEQVTDTDSSEEKDSSSKENLEKKVSVVADEGDTCLKEATEEKEQEALPPALTGEPPLDIEVSDVQAVEYFDSEEKLEELIPAAADERDTGLKDAEEENKEQDKVTDCAPEEKATNVTEERALDNEEIELQAEDNVGSKDELEKQIPTTADESDKNLKEIEEDNKEPVSIIDISLEEKGLATILTDQTTHNAEDTDVKEEEYINSKDIEGESSTEPQEENEEKLSYTDITPEEKILNSQEQSEDQVPVVPDEGHTSLSEAEEENREHIISRDMSTEEKDLPIISTDTALESEEVELKSQENIKSTDNLEKNIPTPADEAEHGLAEAEAEKEEQATITDITPEISSAQSILTSSEEMKLLAEEIVNSADCLEEQISIAAYEGEDILMEDEADNKEQVTIVEITPEEKDLAAILTDKRSLENEETNVQVGEYANSNENLVEEISAAPELGDTCVKEDKEENKEQVKSSDSSLEEKDQDTEYTDVQAGEDLNSEDIADKQIPAAVYEVEPDLKEVEAENKTLVETTEIAPKEKGPATIIIDENVEGIGIIDVQAAEINSKEVSDRQIPTASDEGETDLKVAEADIKEQEESTGSISEQKGVETILSDERALNQEDVDVQKQEKLNSNENLESQIPTTVGEGEGESKEQAQCTESAAEENEVATISRDETVKEQDVNVKAEENPEEAVEGEEKAVILDDIPNNVYNTELVEEATAEQSYQAPSQEEVEPKIAVEVEKPEDRPERSEVMVQEVLDEPKITSRDVSEEQIIEGNVSSCTSESIEEDTVKSSPENEKETEELKEEGSCTENMKEENASDLTREYVPEDATEQIKDEDYNAVKSENEIVQDSQTVKVDDSSTCETKNAERSEEILSTLPVKHDEVQQGEALNVDDGDDGAIAVTETSPEVPSNDEEDSPQVLLQKSEPVEETTKLPDVEPEETTPELSSETAEVTTCTKEERQESLDKQNDTNESDTPSGEVLETAITEALQETHTVDDTAEKATEHQACIEAAELSIEGEKENSEDQSTREFSSSLVGEDTTEESSKEEEKNKVHVECKDAIEEAKSEIIEDTSEPKQISEEESNKSLVEDNSVLSEASETEIEKDIQGEYNSTVRSFDSDVVSDQTGLTEATTEDKELVETTHIAPEEKDYEATDVYSTKVVGETIVEPSVQVQTIEEEAAPKLEVEDETDKTDDLPEKNNKICEEEVLDGPKITDREITEENVAILATEPVEEQETVKDCQDGKIETEKSNEEGSSIENLQEDNSNNIATECIPENKDEKLKEGIEEAVEFKEQITEGNVKSEAELVEDDTVENSQDNEKESIELKESTREESTHELSPEYIQENGDENSKDDKEEAVKSEAEILKASETVEVVESPACETSDVERSEETLGTLPPVPTEALKQENINEDTVSVQGTKENDNVDGAVTLTETSVEVPSNSEDDSAQVLQKYEPEEKLAMLGDMAPEETKPELSSENAEVVTCASEETQESLEIEKDTKEIYTSTGEPCIEATELSTEGEKEEQTTEEVSSSLKGDETTEQSLKEEEKEEAREERKEVIEGTKEETNKDVEDGSYLSEASEEVIEKEIQGDYSSTVRSLDSEDVSEEGGLTEARGQVETTHIAPEAIELSSQVQTLGEEAEPKSEIEDATEKSDDHLENNNQICEEVLDEPKITDRDYDDKQITEEFIASESVEEETVKDPQVDEKERGCSAEGSNANDISIVSVPEVIVGETAECKEEILQEPQKDDGDEETIQIKMAEDKGIVVLPEAAAEETSTGEESSGVTQILELGEEHPKVETSDLETNEGSREAKVSNLALEKLESDAPEESIECEVVPESDFKSPDVVAQDEVIPDQTLDECISKEPSILLSEEKELKASEDEHAKEVEVPTEGEDLLATRSVEEPWLSKEEPRELEVSELAPEKLDAAVTEEETKETSETVSNSDSQSTGVVFEDEIITGQTLCEAEKEPTQVETSDVADEIEVCDVEDKVSVAERTEVETQDVEVSNLATEKLESDAPEEKTIASSEVVPEPDSKGTDVVSQDEVIADQTLDAVISKKPSTLLSEIKELKASEHEHEKEVEVPTEREDLLATRSVETCVSKEEPRELEVSDSAPEKLDTAVTEEETKEASEMVSKSNSQSIAVVCADEIITDQTRCEAEKELVTQVETSDVADEIEVCDLEDKVSAAERTEEETQDVEVSNLATQKLDSDAPEEETVGSSEVVSEPDFKGNDVVSQDEAIADQTLDDVISEEPSTLLSEIKELKASKHEHEKEVEVPTEEVTGESLAARSPEETCLPEEEPRELKVSELALQKLETGVTEGVTIKAFETVSKSNSQSIGVVCEGEKELEASEVVQETLDADAPEEQTKEDSAVVTVDSESTDEPVKEEIIADQTLPEDTSTEQLPTSYSALPPVEKELQTSEHEHETTSVDKNIEENPREVEVPANEDKEELFATPAEIFLHTEEPRDDESVLHKLDACETEEEIKNTFETVPESDSQSLVAAPGDDIIADQTPCEGITDAPISEERDWSAYELALAKLHAEDSEQIKESAEAVPKCDSEIIEVASSDAITIDQAFDERIVMKEQIQSPSSTLLPEEKELESSEPEVETNAQDKITEQECTREVEISANEDTHAILAAKPVEEECRQKEKPSEFNVSEEATDIIETVSRSDIPSIEADPKEEITADETLSKEVKDVPSYPSLHEEKETKASESDLEKPDVGTPEEQTKEGSDVIPQSISCEVSKDEIIADQLEMPSSALLPNDNKLKASENEHETIIDDKNIEAENMKEVREPTNEGTEDVFTARPAEVTCLQNEESSDLKVRVLAPEKLEADETEEIKETFETVSKSDAQSNDAVSTDDYIADQTLPAVSAVTSDIPLDIPTYTTLPKENEEVKEDATELALEKQEVDATEEVQKGSDVTPKSDLQNIDVVVKDEIIADQILHEGITKEQVPVQCSTLLPEEKELKETEHDHVTTTQDRNLEEAYAKEMDVTIDRDTRDVFVASSEEKTHLQKEEPRELKVSGLSPAIVGEEEVASESTDAVTKEDTIAELLDHHDEQLQIASPTLLPKDKEEATVQKEEQEDSKVPELSLKGEAEEETKQASETAPEVSLRSIGEPATDEIVDQISPSPISEEKRCENTTTINKAGEEGMNVVETPNHQSRKDTYSAEETCIAIEEPRELTVSDLELPSSQYTDRDGSNEVHEAKENEASNEEKNLEVATPNSRAEDSCEATVEANQTAKFELPNEEIKEGKEIAKDSQLIPVGELNIRESQQEIESREEKYPEEKNDIFTPPSEYHHEMKPDDKSAMDCSPDGAEGRTQEMAIHLGLENQGDKIKCEKSTTEVTYPVEKDSSMEVSQGDQGEETNGTTQDIKPPEKESYATDIPISKDDAPKFFQEPKLEENKPRNDTLVSRETKEEKVCDSGIEIADPTSAQKPLSERLMEESTQDKTKVVTHLTEEKEPIVGKQLHAEEEEEEEEHENIEEGKTDEEKEDTEHNRVYHGYEEPVIVEASGDTEARVTPRKSHNILSGMGKSVKHSISKVKKAIIGKSSNSKTQSEK